MRIFWMIAAASLAAGCSCGAGSVVDAGSLDGGDATIEDAGGDAAVVDAAVVDAAVVDAATVDAATVDAAGDAGPACETLEMQEIVDAIIEATCTRGRVCATYHSPQRADSCHPTLLEGWYRQRLDAVASGHLEFYAPHACDCLAELSEHRCNPDRQLPLVCQHVFLGTETGRCTTSAECGSSGTCFRTDDVCPGSCFIWGEIGDSCTSVEYCATGLACIDGVCELGRGSGEPCESWADCRFELGCTDGVCGTPAGNGERCDPEAGCAAGLVCNRDGGTCGVGVAEGGACSDVNRCALGLRCASAVCTVARAPGADCASDAECPADFTCDGTCVPLPQIGEACVDRCFNGVCSGGSCVPSPDGAACDPSLPFIRQCEGACDVSRSVCARSAGEGEGCNFVTCEAGLACSPGSMTCLAPCG